MIVLIKGHTYWTIIVQYDIVYGPWPIPSPAAFPSKRWTVESALATKLGPWLVFLRIFLISGDQQH